MKNFGNTVSNTVLASLSTEVGNAVDVVRKQAQALMESVNQPDRRGQGAGGAAGTHRGAGRVLQKVLDKFNNTGMRDIDSLIEIVSELRDITDKLSPMPCRPCRNRINTETGTEGEQAPRIWRTSCNCRTA